jgi:N-methylhydantoinase A
LYDLLHRTTVQRGLDPRKFALFSFGGTAGMHVAAYAEDLGVPDVVVPHSAAVHGAFGLITSDIVHEDQTTHPMHDPVDLAKLNEIFNELTENVRGQLVEEGFEGDRITLQRSIDMRYRRQVHILTVPVQGDGAVDLEVLERTIARFEELYEEKYGKESAYREAGVELVSFRIRGTGSVRKPRFRVHDLGDPDPSEAVAEQISIWVDKAGEMRKVNGYDFERMAPGHRIEGPAVIWTPITTLVVALDQTARVDEYKNVVLATDVAGEGARSRPEHAEVGA